MYIRIMRLFVSKLYSLIPINSVTLITSDSDLWQFRDNMSICYTVTMFNKYQK